MKAIVIKQMEMLAMEYGCIIQVALGRFGWSCTIHDPDLSGTNVATRDSAEEAVELAIARWAEKQYLAKPHLKAEGITVP